MSANSLEEKKKICVVVTSDIADEFLMQMKDWVSDFYGEESNKVEIGELEDAE